MHNKTSHNGKVVLLTKILTRLLIQTSTRIVAHCKESEAFLTSLSNKYSTKIIYIPHPNYIDEYGARILKKVDKEDDILNLLFVGAVKPYKNIELLINTVKSFDTSELNLVIAGKSVNFDYEKYISSLAGNNANISLNLKFVTDSELSKLLTDCDLVILPYDLKSSLNSGTALLAFSYARTVICPAIGTITDINNQSSLLTYTYKNSDEHTVLLREQIEKAIRLKKEDKEIFETWGKNMYQHAALCNDKQAIADSYSALYREISQ